MSVSGESLKKADEEKYELGKAATNVTVDPDDEFGGTERRKKLERKLLWKIDLRMSVLVVIYILNYVSGLCRTFSLCF